MGFKLLDDELWQKKSSRVLLIGRPNTRKTHSICSTWDKPLQIISYPNEQGVSTIPRHDENITPHVWEEEDVGNVALDTTIKLIEERTWEILGGKFGTCETFAGDGLVKLAACYWRREFNRLLMANEQQLAQGRISENDIQVRAYGNENYGACKDICGYVNRVCNSNVKNVVFTVWEGREIDDPDAQKKTSHIYADLPGKLARQIVGEFNVVLYADVGLPVAPGRPGKGTWQTRPKGKVWGVGIKGPVEIVGKIPDEIPQDYQKLKSALQGKEVNWQ